MDGALHEMHHELWWDHGVSPHHGFLEKAKGPLHVTPSGSVVGTTSMEGSLVGTLGQKFLEMNFKPRFDLTKFMSLHYFIDFQVLI